MLPATAHVGRVSLQVSDLVRSLAFYQHALGFRLLDQHDMPGGRRARLGAAGDPACLLELHERPGARPVPPGGRLGLYHFAVLLPDRPHLGRFLLHAAATGLRFAASDHLFSESLYLTDPDGLQVEIYRDLPRTEWRYADGEIVGDTRPLDTNSVVSAAGDIPWQGLPAGTTIGHVHLYVGDLDRARAFYAEALGLTPTLTYFPGALFMAAGGYHHHVGVNIWAAGAPIAAADDARLLCWDLVLPDEGEVAATASRLERRYQVDVHDGAISAADPWSIAVRLVTAR